MVTFDDFTVKYAMKYDSLQQISRLHNHNNENTFFPATQKIPVINFVNVVYPERNVKAI